MTGLSVFVALTRFGEECCSLIGLSPRVRICSCPHMASSGLWDYKPSTWITQQIHLCIIKRIAIHRAIIPFLAAKQFSYKISHFKMPLEIIRAPSTSAARHPISFFLAGITPRIGLSADWRQQICASLTDCPITIYNPWNRRIHAQEPPGGTESFFRRNAWDRERQESADYIVIYFHPFDLSYESLFEVCMATRYPEKTIIVCPLSYIRREHIILVCQRFGFNMVHTLEQLTACIRRTVQERY